MKLRVGAASDIGRARERNEDSYLAVHPLYVVADGMGGHRGGAEASSLAVEVLSNLEKGDDGEHLGERIREANRAVFDRQADDRALAGMGTTVTAVVADGPTIRLGHVGDSRAYLLRDGALRQLTEDHTLVNRMVSEGKISEEEAHTHPQRSIVTRALGVDHDVDVDETEIEVREGDRLLLCTDGLTSMMRDESVAEILGSHPDPQEAAEALVDAANRAGGLDNITVVVMDFEEGEGAELLTEDVKPESESAGSAEVGTRPRAARIPEPSPGALSTLEAEALPALRRAPRWRKPLIWIGAVALVLVLGFVALRIYADRQWYVGVDGGDVAVYQGIPTTIIGIHLSHPVRTTRVSASQAERLAPYRNLRGGITAGSRAEANEIVRTICRDLTTERSQGKTGHVRKPRGCP
jgi:serine/threonine protein phosphatase PrpC